MFRCILQQSALVVERDGNLIMVDDDRMRLLPGEKPMMKKVRFRTLGCYPLSGGVESDADTVGCDHSGDLKCGIFGTYQSCDRQGRRSSQHGETEKGGLLLDERITEIYHMWKCG